MQEVEVLFDYTTIFSLRMLLLLENKNYIPVIKAYGIRRVFEEDAIYKDKVFNKINYNDSLNQFLNKYQNVVYLKNDKIYLKDNIDIDTIDEIIEKMNIDYHVDYNMDVFKYLGINKPIKFIKGLYKFEYQIEKLYTKDYNIDLLQKLLDERNIIIDFLKQQSEEYIDIIYDIQEEMNNKYDRYTLFPIDKKIYKKSEYYDLVWDLEEDFYNPLQVAIFSNSSLYKDKVKFTINSILDDIELKQIDDTIDSEYNDDIELKQIDDTIDSEYNDDIYYKKNKFDRDFMDNPTEMFLDSFESYETITTKEVIFALMYLLEIEKLQNNEFNQNLDKLATRIKYVIDDNNLCLFNKNSEELKIILDNYLEKDDGYYFSYANQAHYFAYEFFNTYPDEYFYKKLLFMKTYYELTQDKEFLKYISQYSNHPNYNDIVNIITDNEKNSAKNFN